MSSKLKEQLRRKCASLDIPMMGITQVERWEKPPVQPWVPKDFWPHSIFPEARSVIVIGLPITLPVLETSPSIFYHELYKNVNALLDQYTYRLALYLTEKGFPSIYVPRDGYCHGMAMATSACSRRSRWHSSPTATRRTLQAWGRSE